MNIGNMNFIVGNYYMLYIMVNLLEIVLFSYYVKFIENSCLVLNSVWGRWGF